MPVPHPCNTSPDTLQDSSRELLILADAIPDFLARFDAGLRHTFVNKALCTALDLPREQILGRSMEEMDFDPKLAATLKQALQDVFNTGEERRLQYVAEIAGEKRELNTRLTPDLDESGKVYSVISVTRDISETVRAHSALQASETRLKEVQRIARLGNYERDLVSSEGFWSDEFYWLMGYAPGEVQNSFELFMGHIHPDDRQRVRAMLQEALERRSDFAAEFRYVRTNRQVRHGFISGNITRDQSGRPVRYHGIMQDVTERKRASEEYSLLVTAIEQANEAISITSAQGVYQYVNPAFERTTGFARREVLGHTPRILSSGHHDSAFYKELWSTITEGLVWRGRFVNRHRSGSIYEAEATISPVRDSTGEVVNFVALMHDITEQSRLEKQLRQAQKMEALGTLAGGIAHDFNNILAAVMGFAEIALMETPEELAQVRENLQDILTGSRRGAELVRNILTFSRQRPHDKRPVEFEPLIKEVMKLLRSSLPSDISIEQDFATQGSMVIADPSELQQLVLNLCTNAAHAMRLSGGALRVALSRHSPEAKELAHSPELSPGEYLRLTVQDNGSGIPRDLEERIFDPFFTTKSPGEGTGLGLSIVHGVVQGMSGALEVQSAPEKGTIVSVLLPLAPGQVEQRPQARQLHKGEGHIMLVEDDQVVARTLKRMLVALGYSVKHFDNGLDALEAFKKNPDEFDLVLTDQIMPGLRGVDLASALRVLAPGVKIILATGFAEISEEEDLRRACIDRVLAKPLELQTLSHALHETLALGKNS